MGFGVLATKQESESFAVHFATGHLGLAALACGGFF
jgi:hypothetical protein